MRDAVHWKIGKYGECRVFFFLLEERQINSAFINVGLRTFFVVYLKYEFI